MPCDVAYAGGRFVAVGNNEAILESGLGHPWLRMTTGTDGPGLQVSRWRGPFMSSKVQPISGIGPIFGSSPGTSLSCL